MKNFEMLKDLNVGADYTLFYFCEFGFPSCEKIKVEDMKIISPFAQYDEAIRLYYTSLGRRGVFQKTFLPYNKVIVWSGHKDVNTNHYMEEKGHYKITDRCFSSNYLYNAKNSVAEQPLIFII